MGGAVTTSSAPARLADAFGTDVTVVAAEIHLDGRGRLTAFDGGAMPFTVRRLFAVTDVPAGTVRGGHRHSHGAQALFCLQGAIEVDLRRGASRLQVLLGPDGLGLLLAAGVWAQQRYVEDGSELLVLASEPYDPTTYDASHT